jgi:DM4/DM12 family
VIYKKYADWTKPKARNFDGFSNTKKEASPKPDSSRRIAYELVEEILSKEGKNGRQCLLRTICEIAETPLSHNGLIGELLEIFFTPGKHENIHNDYRDAQKAGLHHIDCVRLYPDCPFGDGILDTFSIVKEFKFGNLFTGLMK